MARLNRSVTVISVILFFFLVMPGVITQAQGLKGDITYSFYKQKGSFGSQGIADEATAYVGLRKIAQARAIMIITKKPGHKQLIVQETHYDEVGKVSYQGLIHFRLLEIGMASLEEQKAITGVKEYNIFFDWPVGRKIK